MAKYSGARGVVYVAVDGSGAAGPVTGLSNWSLTLDQEQFEVTEFGENNKTYVTGKPDISGSLTGFWHEDQDILFDARDSGAGVRMYLYPSSLAPTRYFYGTAFIKIDSLDVPVGGPVALNASFVAAGSWDRKP